MKLKVKNEELNQVKEKLDDKTVDLQKQLQNLLVQVNELKKVWQGEDAEEFYNKAEIYIKYLEVVPKIYAFLSTVIDGANKTYKQLDSEYAALMKKAVVNHE